MIQVHSIQPMKATEEKQLNKIVPSVQPIKATKTTLKTRHKTSDRGHAEHSVQPMKATEEETCAN